MTYLPTTANFTLDVYTDSSHANDLLTRRSIGGHLIVINGCVIDWVSQHQPYVTLSSQEAEVVAASNATTHCLYWQEIIKQMKLPRPDTVVHIDATAAMQLLSEPKHYSRSRHIAVRLLFTREHYKAREFKFNRISGNSNPADGLTKPISRDRQHIYFDALRSRNGVPVFVIGGTVRRPQGSDPKRPNSLDSKTSKKKRRLASDILSDTVVKNPRAKVPRSEETS